VKPIGPKAPDFVLPSPDGTSISLSQALDAGPVALFFYKTECPTCALAFPFVQRLHERGAAVLGIAQNGAEEVRSYQSRFGATFPGALDEPFFLTSTAYGVEMTPTLFLVEPGGRIADAVEAWQRDGYDRIAAALAGGPLVTDDDGVPAFRPG